MFQWEAPTLPFFGYGLGSSDSLVTAELGEGGLPCHFGLSLLPLFQWEVHIRLLLVLMVIYPTMFRLDPQGGAAI